MYWKSPKYWYDPNLKPSRKSAMEWLFNNDIKLSTSEWKKKLEEQLKNFENTDVIKSIM